MKKCSITFICLFLFVAKTYSQQQTITLDICQEMARVNYPLIKQYDLISAAEKYTLDNALKNYLPQISFNAQASYQTDVTKLGEIPIPNLQIPTADKDQYKATIDVSQMLWDGGATQSQQKIIKANTEIEKEKIDVSLYAIREKINQLYFGLLAIDEQLKILDILNNNLQNNYDVASSLLRNGVVMQSDVDLIKVELLNLDQNRTEQTAKRDSYLKILSLFVNQHLDSSTLLEKPITDECLEVSINRPELLLYSKQRNLFDSQQTAITAKNMPKLGLFVQGGYGKPGLNMLESKFRFFAIGGVKLSWNFGSLYTKENEQKLIKNNIGMLDIQEETFRFNTNTQLSQMQIEIQKYKDLMKNDDEIIGLRKRIRTAGESKYKNGVYQMSDLIRDINAESQSALTKSIHEVQYLQSIYSYRYTQGY